MGVRSSVKVTMNQAALAGVERRAFTRMITLAYDIKSANARRAPVLTGALRNSIRVEVREPEIEVKAGGNMAGKSVPYGLVREFINYAHPSTKHYMEFGMNDVVSGDWVGKYFRGL